MSETRILSEPEVHAYATGLERGRASEREQIIALVQGLEMQDLLLAMGEMTAQERRTCRALIQLIVLRIRNRSAK